MSRDQPHSGRRRVASGLTILAIVTLILAALVAPAAAATPTNNSSIDEKAPYYENVTAEDPDDGWFNDGDVTLDGVIDMFMRIPSLVIGTGSLDPSGTGLTGVLLTAVVLAGSVLVTMMGTGVGPVGGTIVALTAAFGLTATGFAPQWIWPVLLFGVGIVIARAVRRSMG